MIEGLVNSGKYLIFLRINFFIHKMRKIVRAPWGYDDNLTEHILQYLVHTKHLVIISYHLFSLLKYKMV